MGTDIHCVIEFKLKITGNWELFGYSSGYRNYQLFSRIADVRNEPYGHKDYIEPIHAPRGFPDDAAELTRILYGWSELAFSATYLTRDELLSLQEWWKDSCARLYAPDLVEALGFTHGLPVGCTFDWACRDNHLVNYFDDVRLICWFDN
jgi:hypothetical protein